jgi:hypothetical protein
MYLKIFYPMILMFLSACVQEVDLQLQSGLKLPSTLYLDQMQNSNLQHIDFLLLDSSTQSIQDAKIDSSMLALDMHLAQIDQRVMIQDQMVMSQDQMVMSQDQMVDDQMLIVDMILPPIEPQFPTPPVCDENQVDICSQIAIKINELNYVNQANQNGRTMDTFIEIDNPHQYVFDDDLQVSFYQIDFFYDFSQQDEDSNPNNRLYLEINPLARVNDCIPTPNSYLYYTCLLSDVEDDLRLISYSSDNGRWYFDPPSMLVILSYQNIAVDALFISNYSSNNVDISLLLNFLAFNTDLIELIDDLQISNLLSIQFVNQFDQNYPFQNDQSINRCPSADAPRQVNFQLLDLSFGLANPCR